MYLSRQHTSPIQKSEFQCMLVLLASTLFSHWVVGLLLDQQLSENMIFFPLNAVNQTTEYFLFSSVQSLSRVRLFVTPWTAACQASLSITNSRSYSNSCPSRWWCHPTISSSVTPFSSCLQSFPASGSFPLSQIFASGGQSIGVSASASVLSMHIQDWFPLGWTGWISLQSKGLSRVFSNTIVQKHQVFGAQLSL